MKQCLNGWQKIYQQKNISKIKSKEIYRDLFIFTSMLTNQDMLGAQNINFNISLKQIHSPDLFLEKMIDKIVEMLADESQFEKDPKTGKIAVRLCHPDSFYKNKTVQCDLALANIVLVCLEENEFICICRTSFAEYILDWFIDASYEYGIFVSDGV